MNKAQLYAAAHAQIDSSVCFFLVTVDDAAVLKFAVMKGTALEESAMATHARTYATLVVGVQAEGMADALAD